MLPRTNCLCLIPRKLKPLSTFHTTNVQQVEEKSKEPDWAIPSAIPPSLPPFSTSVPKFFQPLPSLLASSCSPSHSHLLQVSRQSSQHLHSSQPVPQQLDTATCASPVGWWMKNIAGYVMCKAESHRYCLVSYSLLHIMAGESWFLCHEGDSIVARLTIFLFSLSVHNLNTRNKFPLLTAVFLNYNVIENSIFPLL